MNSSKNKLNSEIIYNFHWSQTHTKEQGKPGIQKKKNLSLFLMQKEEERKVKMWSNA